MSNLMTDSNSRSNLLRIGALVAIACLVATAVWLGARGRADGSDKTTTGDPSSLSTQSSGVEQTAPETAPTDGVVIPGGADQANGYPTGFPQTDLGAVALQIEVAKAQVGFDYDQAVTVAGLYADPADKAVFEERARDAVALRRQQAGVPRDGDVPTPASYAETRTVGEATLQVLWPRPDSPSTGPGDGSTANDAALPIALTAESCDLATLTLFKQMQVRRIMLKPFKVKTVLEVVSELAAR